MLKWILMLVTTATLPFGLLPANASAQKEPGAATEIFEKTESSAQAPADPSTDGAAEGAVSMDPLEETPDESGESSYGGATPESAGEGREYLSNTNGQSAWLLPVGSMNSDHVSFELIAGEAMPFAVGGIQFKWLLPNSDAQSAAGIYLGRTAVNSLRLPSPHVFYEIKGTGNQLGLSYFRYHMASRILASQLALSLQRFSGELNLRAKDPDIFPVEYTDETSDVSFDMVHLSYAVSTQWRVSKKLSVIWVPFGVQLGFVTKANLSSDDSDLAKSTKRFFQKLDVFGFTNISVSWHF